MATLSTLVGELGEETGLVVMTEEALIQSDWSALTAAISAQPSWSAYPFLLLVSQRRDTTDAETIYARLPSEISNVMVLERPVSSAVLLSTVRWALGARRRQYVTRDHLAQLERTAAQQRLMTRELAHRVKNTIAILQSIVTQTMRPYPEMKDVSAAILERFSALSRAHDLLLGTDFTAAGFHELVDRSLSVHQGTFEIAGPPIELSPQAALSFALVLHELATNSAKYGALSAAHGAVALNWTITQTDEPVFRFDWIESGGPAVHEPTTSGFGSRLIRNTLAGLGEVHLRYPPDGFRLEFTGPVAELTHIVVPEFETAWDTAH